MTAVMWFRGDLRVADNVALHAACEHERLIPLFLLDFNILRGRHSSKPRTRFMLESLGELDGSLRERGSGLVVRSGWDVVKPILALARATVAREVHATAAATPYARRRDRRVAAALGAKGVALRLHPGAYAVDHLADLRTRQGRPYTVFTPFHRAWLAAPRRAVLDAPDRLPRVPDGVAAGRLTRMPSLTAGTSVQEPLRGGERAARERLEAFLRDTAEGYATGRDEPGRDGTSRLSSYLHFGCISARTIEDRLVGGEGPDAFRRQLCWRDFHHHVIGHFPANARWEFQERYRGTMIWNRDESVLTAWREGQTGYPLVDAGMRQLLREGWMHNRVRLVVGSFLTKDLGIDWRAGEAHFMSLLLDGDEAVNNGNWQWIASVGVDPQPAPRRLYNPTLQMRRLDPEGEYVRRYVPELRGVPDEYLAEPWTMPPDVQRQARCRIGLDYPEPLVDHRRAREEALQRYRDAAASRPTP